MKRIASMFLICVLTAPLGAQKPKAPPRMTFGGPKGKPLSHGCVFAFIPGTETPLQSYADPEHTRKNPNPMILDRHGAAAMFFDQPYKLQMISQGGRNCTKGKLVGILDMSGHGDLNLRMTP